MPKLHAVGWDNSPDNIEDSLRTFFEKAHIDVKKGDDNTYVTFENINFERKKDAGLSVNLKDAILNQKSVLTKIYADVVKVTDGSRRTVAKQVLIGHVPQLIEGRNTFLINGSEYNVVNQLRRDSSSYVGMDNNQNVYAEFNLAKGRNFDIEMDPIDSLFYVSMGTSKILIKVLADAVGMTGDEFKAVVGDKFYKANWDFISQPKFEQNYRKLYGKLYEYKDEDVKLIPFETLKQQVKEYFTTTKVDPTTTKYLYDIESNKVDKQLLSSTLKKFIAVNDGDEPPVDVDDLYYQRLYPPNLLFKDRLERLLPEITNKLRFKLKTSDEGYDKTFKGLFSKPLVSMVNSSDLARLDPQYNPMGIFSTGTIVSPMGLGGIHDVQAVKRSTRAVHNSNMGVIDPIATPQGEKVGIQQRLVEGIKVDDHGDIYLPLRDKHDNVSDVKLKESFYKYIRLPGQDNRKGSVAALYKGNIVDIDSSKIDYEFSQDTGSLLSDLNKLIPFPQATQGNRNFMSYRFVTQALPLQSPETPNVLPINERGESTYHEFRKKLEKLIPSLAPVTGFVKDIRDSKIIIKGDDGETHELPYHKHLPFATNTGVHQRPLVRPGYRVTKGERVLSDPYTDREGNLAFGKNLKSAFVPYYGFNSDDAVVISESAGQKLTSIHYYKYQVTLSEDKIVNKSDFRSIYGSKYDESVISKLDSDGVIVQNSKINYGDIVVAVIERKSPDDKLSMLGKISKEIVVDKVDSSEVYDHHTEGEVIEVVKTPKLISVIVKVLEPATVGDKISNLYGGKGVIASVVPDDKFLRGEDGKPIDIAWSSSVVVSRINPGQILENALSKIVVEKGIPKYKVPIMKNKNGKPLNEWVSEELKKHNVKDKERIFDPVRNAYIKNPIATGNMYVVKLLKPEKDLTARGVGPYYTSTKQPAKGGNEGAKAVGAAEFDALVAHNARQSLNEMSTIKGQYNPEFWKNFELGTTTPLDKPSFAWDSMKAMLTAGGGYVRQVQNGYDVVPVTDSLTDNLAGHRIIKTPALLKSKSDEPIKKGLYDPDIVGGINGNLWAKIELRDGIVSPLVTDYMRLVMGKTKEQMHDWQAETDTKGMKKELDTIDTDELISQLEAKSLKKDLENNEIKVLRFLKNMKDKGIKLKDLVITSIPVPPPIYRPIVKLEDGNMQMHDINLFYKDIMLADEALEGLDNSEYKTLAKKTLIDNIDAMVGKRPPLNIQLQRKGVNGVLSHIGGVGSPKTGFIHSRLIKKTQDMTGRARIVPDAKMDMDTIGVPEHIAWKIFEPHIRKAMLAGGYPVSEVEKHLAAKSALAKQYLLKTMETMPVWYNRAPTLHRYGFLVGKPVLTNGNTIAVNMFSTAPLNADFDGDAIQIHAPVTNPAQKEMEKYKLSNIVFSDSDMNRLITKLTVEAVIGFYQMSIEDAKRVKKDIYAIVGDSDIPLEVPLTKKKMEAFLVEVSKKYPEKVNKVFTELKLLGEDYATEIGSTVGISDIQTPTKERNRLITAFRPKYTAAKSMLDKATTLEALQKQMVDLAKEQTDSDLSMLVRSGAKGSDNQLAGLLVTPTIAYDPDRPVDTARLTEHSYSEGLPIREFWEQNAKSRKDLVSTSLSVAEPGSLGKLLVSATNRETITSADCGTKKGIYIDWDNQDVLGRYLQEDIPRFTKDTPIMSDNRDNLPHRKIYVRSPQTCESLDGVCQKCYGVDSRGKPIDIGVNVGIRSSMSIAETMQQMGLDSKHGGRSISRDIGKGGIKDLLRLFSSDADNPEIAVIARDHGIVDYIEELPSGMKLIRMRDGDKYKVSRLRNILVSAGESVDPGQKLTDGIIPFTDVASSKGINAGRQALSGELKRIMDDNGKRFHSRLYETIAKAAVNYIEFDTPWGEYSPGDVITYNKFVGLCDEKGIDTTVGMLQPGMYLAEEFDDMSVGYKLDLQDIARIKKSDTKKIKVLPGDVRVKPVARSLYTSGLTDDDWMTNMAGRYIKKHITEAVNEGDVQPENTTSPFAKWMMGRPFKINSPTY